MRDERQDVKLVSLKNSLLLLRKKSLPVMHPAMALERMKLKYAVSIQSMHVLWMQKSKADN